MRSTRSRILEMPYCTSTRCTRGRLEQFWSLFVLLPGTIHSTYVVLYPEGFFSHAVRASASCSSIEERARARKHADARNLKHLS